MKARRPWPKLSQDLDGPLGPLQCQSCGWDCDLVRWVECDDADQPTAAVVVLCHPCSDRLIEPHPRLYAPLDAYAPHPGSMTLCIDCSHRQGVSCRHPDLRANGGAGLHVRFPQPTPVFVDGTKGGKRHGWVHTLYHGPPISCAGQTITPHKEDTHAHP